MTCEEMVRVGPITCPQCQQHPVVINKRIIPARLAGEDYPYDFHCITNNTLVLMKN